MNSNEIPGMGRLDNNEVTRISRMNNDIGNGIKEINDILLIQQLVEMNKLKKLY